MSSRFSILGGLCLLAALPFAAQAQTTDTQDAAATKPGAYKGVDCFRLANHSAATECYDQNAETKIFRLSNVPNQNDANEILVAVRNIANPSIRIYMNTSQSAIVVRDYPQDMARVENLIHELDKPRKTFRLTYTIAVLENGKNIGTQHYSLVASDGQRTTMKEGDKIPVATGSFSTDNAASQTQFTYLDVGMSFDATVNSMENGVSLKTKVEQSSLGPSTTIAGVAEPVVRQSVLEGVSAVTLGKPLMLGSIDVPNSTRHLDIDVMVEQIR